MSAQASLSCDGHFGLICPRGRAACGVCVYVCLYSELAVRSELTKHLSAEAEAAVAASVADSAVPVELEVEDTLAVEAVAMAEEEDTLSSNLLLSHVLS